MGFMVHLTVFGALLRGGLGNDRVYLGGIGVSLTKVGLLMANSLPKGFPIFFGNPVVSLLITLFTLPLGLKG